MVDRAYERDPVGAASEYGGEWRSDIAAFMSRDAVLSCVDANVRERPFQSGVKYAAFVDPSGGSNDSMTLCISHKEGERAVIDVVREAKPPFSPENVVAEFCDLMRSYYISRVTGDRYAGEWPRERFRLQGIIYELADKPASQLFLEFLPLVNAGRVGLLDHRRLVDQLLGLERRTSFTGKDSVGHPPNGHDDIAVAAAGAVLLSTARAPRLLINGRLPLANGMPDWSPAGDPTGKEGGCLNLRHVTINDKTGAVIREEVRRTARDRRYLRYGGTA